MSKSLPKSLSKSHRRAKSAQASASETTPRSARAFAADYFSFHAVCEGRNCRRAKRCEGGAMPPCFTAFWPHIEDREKMRFRGFIKALGDGASAQDAIAAGDAEAARCDALAQRLQQLELTKAAPPLVEQPAAPLAITRVPRAVARVRQL